jgi:hypothetical protein
VPFHFASHVKFSRSSPKPASSSCRLYTGCRLVRLQSSSFAEDNFFQAHPAKRVRLRFRQQLTLSMRHRRFACAHLLNAYLPSLMTTFPRTLTTTPFECSSIEAVCGLRLLADHGGPEGHKGTFPSIFSAAPKYRRILQFFVRVALPVRVRMKEFFQLSLDPRLHHLLRHSVGDRRHAQHSNATVFLGNLHLLHRRRDVTPRGHPVP